MAAQKILLAYNHTPHDRKALNFVIEAFADREHVSVTLLNTYPPIPQIDLDSSPELGKLRLGLAALQEELEERRGSSPRENSSLRTVLKTTRWTTYSRRGKNPFPTRSSTRLIMGVTA